MHYSSGPIIGGSESNANHLNSNFSDAGFLLCREDSGEIINAQHNYWEKYPPHLEDVFPVTEFYLSSCLEIPVSVDNRNKTFYLRWNYKLSQNYPNPFNPSRMISYSILNSDLVSLKIHDLYGNEIETLINEFQRTGTYSVYFDVK